MLQSEVMDWQHELVSSRVNLIRPVAGGWPLPRDHRSVCEGQGANQRPRHKTQTYSLISMWSSITSHNSWLLSTKLIRRRPWQVMWHYARGCLIFGMPGCPNQSRETLYWALINAWRRAWLGVPLLKRLREIGLLNNFMSTDFICCTFSVLRNIVFKFSV